MEKKDIKKSQGGFTLIEIIAVLVILGILAAVAVPRFLNLSDEAELKAAEGAMSACVSQLSLEFAKHLLDEGTTDDFTPTDVTLQDYACAYENTTGDVEITLSSTSYTVPTAAATKTVELY